MNDQPHNSQQFSNGSGRSVAEIQDWIVNRLATELRVASEKIKVDQPILASGIDSVQVVSVMSELEDWGDFRFSENPLDDHPTTESLALFVADLTRKNA